jgi:hypothetical protein
MDVVIKKSNTKGKKFDAIISNTNNDKTKTVSLDKKVLLIIDCINLETVKSTKKHILPDTRKKITQNRISNHLLSCQGGFFGISLHCKNLQDI